MSDALPLVYLVRHGATAWTQTGQHTGRTDLALNEQGEREARELVAEGFHISASTPTSKEHT